MNDTMLPLKTAPAIDGVIHLRARVDVEASNNCWNAPKRVIIKAGQVIKTKKGVSSSDRGAMFFSLERGEGDEVSVKPCRNAFETRNPYCHGFYSPDHFEALETL